MYPRLRDVKGRLRYGSPASGADLQWLAFPFRGRVKIPKALPLCEGQPGLVGPLEVNTRSRQRFQRIRALYPTQTQSLLSAGGDYETKHEVIIVRRVNGGS